MSPPAIKPVWLVLVHLVVRDSLAGHLVRLRFVLDGTTVARHPGPARTTPSTGQDSFRQPAKAIVAGKFFDSIDQFPTLMIC
jgi:hypothetical protein